MKIRLKPKHLLHTACEALELVAALLMIVGIALAFVGFITDGALFRSVLAGETEFLIYIERVFAIVIGIEFLEMLYKPTSDSVIRTLIFLVARHMIVGETTPVQDLVSVVSITILFVLRRWLKNKDNDSEHAPGVISRLIGGGKRGAAEASGEENQ